METAIGLCEDFDATSLRALAKKGRDANQIRRLLVLAVLDNLDDPLVKSYGSRSHEQSGFRIKVAEQHHIDCHVGLHCSGRGCRMALPPVAGDIDAPA